MPDNAIKPWFDGYYKDACSVSECTKVPFVALAWLKKSLSDKGTEVIRQTPLFPFLELS